jgi:toxin ParE1/3/4
MKSTLRLRPEAEADLQEAYRWYEGQRSGLGDDLLLCVEAALQVLQDNPNQFPEVYKEVRRLVLRRFPYSIFYLSRSESVV